MDNLEFRIFYGNKMHGHEEACRVIYNNSSRNNLFHVKHPVMQFTGIKDRGGWKVFDGDIIQDTLTKAEYIVNVGFCKKGGYTGVYGESLDGLITSINNDSGHGFNTQIEIIGNIYESKNQKL